MIAASFVLAACLALSAAPAPGAQAPAPEAQGAQGAAQATPAPESASPVTPHGEPSAEGHETAPATAEGHAPAPHAEEEDHSASAVLMHHVVDVRWGHLFVGPVDLGPTKHLAFFAGRRRS